MQTGFTAAELSEIKAYWHALYVWAALEPTLNLLVLVVWVRWLVRPFFSGSERLALRLERATPQAGVRRFANAVDRVWRGPGWGAALLFVGISTVFFLLVGAPARLVMTFGHERAFGTLRYDVARWLRDVMVGAAGVLLAKVALAFGMLGIARRLIHWWLVLAVVVAAVLSLSRLAAPVRPGVFVGQRPLARGELRQRLETLSHAAHIEIADFIVLDASRRTAGADALLGGRDGRRLVYLSDTLVDGFSPDEIEAAVAHELGHASQITSWLDWMGPPALVFLFFWLLHRLMAIAEKRRWLGIREYADPRQLVLVSLVMFVLLTAVEPFAAAASRERELEADRFALRLLRNPKVFRAMLIHLAKVDRIDPDPPRWFVLLGDPHPPLVERLALADPSDEKTAGRRGPPPRRPHPRLPAVPSPLPGFPVTASTPSSLPPSSAQSREEAQPLCGPPASPRLDLL